VTAQGEHIHVYLDCYYVARLSAHGDHWSIDGARLVPCQVPSEEHAREVVRMWVDHFPQR